MGYHRLRIEEREEISRLLVVGVSVRSWTVSSGESRSASLAQCTKATFGKAEDREQPGIGRDGLPEAHASVVPAADCTVVAGDV